ncbi:MAG: hypothetical protein LBM98_09510 [Oscillospiraceae bacterium]|nr:hypothetical protein [Oscillospiraceae bacterium]
MTVRRDGGRRTWVTLREYASPQPTFKPPSSSPLWRGAARRRRGGFPRRARTRPNYQLSIINYQLSIINCHNPRL